MVNNCLGKLWKTVFFFKTLQVTVTPAKIFAQDPSCFINMSLL